MGFNSYEFRLLRAKRHADKVKQDQIVHEVRHRNDYDSGKKKMQSSKLGLWLLFLDAFFIQVFCMWLIAKYASEMNVSTLIGSLIGLIGTIFVQAMGYQSYAKKSTAENTVGGIVYQNMQNEFRQGILNLNENDSVISSPTNTMATDDEDAVG